MSEHHQYAIGDKVKLGRTLELESTYEVVATCYDDQPDLVLIQHADYPADHPGVYPWVANIEHIRPAT